MDLGPRYGFTLENYSEVDLFPYLFYFDPSDYSIQAWYIPPRPTVFAPLKRRKSDTGTQAQTPSSSTSPLDARPTPDSSRYS
ncbi:hypothetical protein HD554DRAFT_1543784 [Boletus coccyginus]|nr:hypothetical protein HD554DRAFT_1543784 [Boletus coccyginus]